MYGAITWTLTKTLESKLDETYTRMLRTALNLSWRQLYGNIPPLTTILRERRMRFAGHCWRAKQELISGLLLWSPRHGKNRPGCPSTTYIYQLCRDMECTPDDLPALMQDRDEWRDRLHVRVSSTGWWWYNITSCIGIGNRENTSFVKLLFSILTTNRFSSLTFTILSKYIL